MVVASLLARSAIRAIPTKTCTVLVNAAYDRARQRYFSLLQKPVPETHGKDTAAKAPDTSVDPGLQALEKTPEKDVKTTLTEHEPGAPEPADPQAEAAKDPSSEGRDS